MAVAGNSMWSLPLVSVRTVFLLSMCSEELWNSWVSYSVRQPQSAWVHDTLWYLAVWIGIPLALTLVAVLDGKYHQWRYGQN
jgi:hypothetical protein